VPPTSQRPTTTGLLAAPYAATSLHDSGGPFALFIINLTVYGYVGWRAGRQFSGQRVHHLTRIRRELVARLEIVHQQFAGVHRVVFTVWKYVDERNTRRFEVEGKRFNDNNKYRRA